MKRKILSAILIIALLVPNPALAISLIRDAEIEKTLRDYSAPIFRAAGLDADSMKIYIVNDQSINAFTVGGLNVFLNTGLILQADNSNMIIGVVAHETGHVAGGHIIKKIDEAGNLNVQAVLAAVLGAAVSVAGLPGAGMAVMAGGQHIANRNFMSFNREQEVAADAAALKYLGKTGESAQGMLKLFEILRRDQTLNYGDVDPYTISHPLSQERIAHIRSQTIDDPLQETDKYANEHARMKAKLFGFLEKPENTFLKYTDDSVPSVYARSIAYFRQSNFPKAFAEIDRLIAAYPTDPFFNELKGQFLVESGKPNEAIPYYQKANQLYPNSALIKSELGKILLGENKVDDSINVLSQAAKIDPTMSEIWRLLGTAYGKKNNTGMSELMLAEEANVLGRNDQARALARSAKDKLPKDSSGWIRANDLLADIKLNKKKNKEDDPE